MGEELLLFYKEKVKGEYKVAFISTFVISILIHVYKFVNTLPNHDSIYNYYSDQNLLGSGRWALAQACLLSSYHDLPWINGFLSCIFLALTVVVIVAIFKLKNPILIGLIGGLLAASPAVTETFFYLFTADGYMIAMFLAALSVYFSRMEERRISRYILSGVCICVTCGIYQAYVSFALILAVCYFMDALLQNNYSKQECLKWVLRQVITYVLSLAAYFVIWKLIMYFSGAVANNYQGISDVGKISAGILVTGLINATKTTVLYFLQWNVFSLGFSVYSVLNILLLGALALGLLLACIKSGIFKRKWAVVLLILCLVAIIPFACMWYFTSGSLEYRPRMLQSLALLFVFVALLYERWAKPFFKNVVCVLLIAIVFNNALMANISYFYMHQCYEKTYADGVEMMMEIHNFQDAYEFDKIAIVGDRIYDLKYENYDLLNEKMKPSGKLHILSSLLEKNLLFDSDHTMLFLQGVFGLDLDALEREQRNELLDTKEVQAMGCWPAGDSVTVIDNVLVIKLSDRKEAE